MKKLENNAGLVQLTNKVNEIVEWINNHDSKPKFVNNPLNNQFPNNNLSFPIRENKKS